MRIVSLLVLLAAAPVVAESPRLAVTRDPSGVGLLLPGGLWLSGDATVALAVPEHGPTVAELDDVRLLARWEPVSRFALFGDVRFENLIEVIDGRGVVTGEREAFVERLYGELLVTPRLAVRAGKTFTPFGLWNVISRGPLTWTVEEPAIAETTFPIRATGLSVLYRDAWRGWSVDATAYGPVQDEIVLEHRDERGFLFGGRAALGRDLGPAFAAVGLNAAAFRDYDRKAWTTATGLDLEVFARGHELTGELMYRVPTDRQPVTGGLYLQDAFPLVDQLYGVLRFEYREPPRGDAVVGQLVGVFWRPRPNVIVKADYLFGNRAVEDFDPGLHVSLSLLF